MQFIKQKAIAVSHLVPHSWVWVFIWATRRLCIHA